MHKSSHSFIAALVAFLLALIAPIFLIPVHADELPGAIALGVYFWQNDRLAPADQSAISDLRHRAGRLPAVFLIYQGWTGDYAEFPIREAQNARVLGKPLHICWEPWNGHRDDVNFSCAAVSSGTYDSYLRRYACRAREFGGPLLIRLAHEMNGDWYPWGTANSARFRRNNGNAPANYVAMWRHVVSIFREEGADNVQWVWAPNIFYVNAVNSPLDQRRDLEDLFPGDAWVDWIGLSVFNDGVRHAWRSFPVLFDDAYRVVTRLSEKPLMIAEMGATEQGAPEGTSKAAWIEQTLLYDIPARYPRVRMVNWFCRDKTANGEANYRFDSSPQALRAFRAAVNSPLYTATIDMQIGASRLVLR